ncbi:DUF1178 family protein [Benzoatithermus flavus]|uniref:DUF1178 family protein n=1 Tax=Benzoatithermus flavus TaxID=3108223 RepID=A0ABU8XLD9_9PROT
MIRFALNCARDHAFEGWFKDSAAFDRQAEEGAITCPVCGDTSVRKAVMAPAVIRSGGRREPAPTPPSAPVPAPTPEQARAMMMMAMLRQIRAHVEKNFDDVGERFPEEARKIHYGEAEARDIYGKATLEEAKELIEEGIAVLPLPDLPKLDS